MPRENSFSDSEGRSLTPDPEDGLATSPTYTGPPAARPSADNAKISSPHSGKNHPHHHGLQRSYTSPPTSPSAPFLTPHPIFLTPTDRFRSAVRKVMAMRSMSSLLARRGVGAEPGADPRSAAAFLNYGHIRQECTIDVHDYSTVRTRAARMTNGEFLRFLAGAGTGEEGASGVREPWVRVRWINVGGISWDVMSALALKYGELPALGIECTPLSLNDLPRSCS